MSQKSASSTSTLYPLASSDVFPSGGVLSAKHSCDSDFTPGDLACIKETFGFSDDVVLHIPTPGQKADFVRAGWICLYEYAFRLGLRFPFPPLIQEFLNLNRLAICRVAPYTWRTLLAIVAMNSRFGYEIGLSDLAHLFSVRSLSRGQVTIRVRDGEKNCIIFPVKPDDSKWFSRFIFVKIDTLPAPTDYIVSAWRSTDDLCPLPLSSDKTASLSKLFGPPPENRTFPDLVQDSAAVVKKSAAEEKESMSTGSAKSRISLEDVLAERVKDQVAIAPKPAKKRKSTPAPSSGPRPKRRSAAANWAKEQSPTEATPLAVRPPLPGHGLSTSGDPPVPKPTPVSVSATSASGTTPIPETIPASRAASGSKPAPASKDIVFSFPDDFGKAKSERNLGLMDQLLFPAPESVMGTRALRYLADRAAEQSFESFQMSLYLRRKVPLLEAENAKFQKLAKEANEDRLKIQADLDRSQSLLLEEAA
ncbi:uncharacterized protein LOC141602258 [Silene latifolia]|uniref:uncharacterized protein LOC141602258 n=1 Tax=Silene latifolia TaxID=37657 RepID=UPI003D770C88